MFIILFGANYAVAQIKVEGTISHNLGIGIAGANILVLQDSTGAVSSENGSFELNFSRQGNYKLQITHIQFQAKIIHIKVNSFNNEVIEVILDEKQEILDELEVIGSEPSVIAVSRVRINTLNHQLSPVPFQDISNILATLPSVTSNNELSTAYSVRGGSYDENLVLVNNIPVYRPFLVRSGQEEGLSFINIDLISTVEFCDGGGCVGYFVKMA